MNVAQCLADEYSMCTSMPCSFGLAIPGHPHISVAPGAGQFATMIAEVHETTADGMRIPTRRGPNGGCTDHAHAKERWTKTRGLHKLRFGGGGPASKPSLAKRTVIFSLSAGTTSAPQISALAVGTYKRK